MLKQDSVFHDTKVWMDVFKKKFNEEMEKHKQTIADISQKYNTVFGEKERQKENLRHTKAVEELKTGTYNRIADSLGQQRTMIENAVKDSLQFTTDTRVFEVLNNLSNMPLSQAEFDCIAKKVDVTGNYFRKKALSEVAKSHGLHYDFSPIDAQIKALDSMDTNVRAFLFGAQDFEFRTPIGSTKQDIPPVEEAAVSSWSKRLVSEGMFEQLDEMFSSGYSGTTPSGQAAEKLSYLKDQHRPSATASFIDNVIDTEPNTSVRHEFMKKVASDPAYTPFLEDSKHKAEFDALRNTKSEPDHIPGETPKAHAERKAAEVAKRKQQFEVEVQQKAQDMNEASGRA